MIGSAGRTPYRRGLAWVVAPLLLLGLAATGCTPDGQAPPEPSEKPAGPVPLSVAVYGPAPVIDAYRQIAADFTAAHSNVVVTIKPYDSHDAELGATRTAIADGRGPNLFLTMEQDLTPLRAEGIISPVDKLLGERHVDFGDGFPRDALEAYSDDAALQCMPTELSPLVVYYNTRLVDLTRAQDPGGSPISADNGWGLEEFARAARQASKHGHRGVYVAPDLTQVAPFVWSGGGQVVDNPDQPTTLTLSSGSSLSAMQRLLEVVRNPHLTFSRQQLERRSALDRFTSGQLAMILGFRDLTPVLRAKRHLHFDVLPLPSLHSRATIGQMSAMCMTRAKADTGPTADFLAYLVSDQAMTVLARTGYVMPTNLSVTSSDAFLQPGKRPASGSVFTDQVRRVHRLPDVPAWPGVEAMAGRRLEQLFYDPVIDPLADRLAALDTDSSTLLAPPTESPTPTPSGSASPSSSPTTSAAGSPSPTS